MFEKILGIGKVLAKRLNEEYGEPKDLDEAYKLLSGNNSLPSSTRQEISLRPWYIVPKIIIDELNKDLKTLTNLNFEIAGSYKREEPYSGDVDIVINCGRNVLSLPIYKYLCGIETNKFSFNTEPYSMGNDKISLLLYLPYLSAYIVCDMFFTNQNEYPFMLFYATGSKMFNIRMRKKAKMLNGNLNQTSLVIGNKKIKAKSEMDIMSALNVEYLEPKDRKH
jgi:DNA polymerase/3'-5' exonuclease PolX